MLSLTPSSFIKNCRNKPESQEQNGFSLLEFVIVLCVGSLLLYYLMVAIDKMQAEAERTSFQENLTSIVRAINYEAMSRVSSGRAAMIPELTQASPFIWIQSETGQLTLEVDQLKPQTKGLQGWYYDPQLHEFGYQIKNNTLKQHVNAKEGVLRYTMRVSAGGHGVEVMPRQVYVWQDF